MKTPQNIAHFLTPFIFLESLKIALASRPHTTPLYDTPFYTIYKASFLLPHRRTYALDTILNTELAT